MTVLILLFCSLLGISSSSGQDADTTSRYTHYGHEYSLMNSWDCSYLIRATTTTVRSFSPPPPPLWPIPSGQLINYSPPIRFSGHSPWDPIGLCLPCKDIHGCLCGCCVAAAPVVAVVGDGLWQCCLYCGDGGGGVWPPSAAYCHSASPCLPSWPWVQIVWGWVLLLWSNDGLKGSRIITGQGDNSSLIIILLWFLLFLLIRVGQDKQK